MTFTCLTQIAFWCAVVPSALFCWNLFYFRRPPHSPPPGDVQLPRISVLIPARNEERTIGAAVASVLASEGVVFELIVLDDASTDTTARIVEDFAALDSRVRCLPAPPLAAGWAGKAHAAHVLSTLARYEVFCFIDADVRIGVDTLARMERLLAKQSAALVSGFPEEETVTTLEWLLLPLIHFMLLCYLPFAGLRYTKMAAFGAGCGQFIMTTGAGYRATGGYASVRTTMHDGITLAKLFRRHGYRTNVADLTGLAHCRMYHSGSDVWSGLTKNATEGIGAPGRIIPFTLLLFSGQILPWPLLAYAVAKPSRTLLVLMGLACAASLLPRVISIWRFKQRSAGALLHPAGVALLLVLQWAALLRKLRGTRAQWKGRTFEVG